MRTGRSPRRARTDARRAHVGRPVARSADPARDRWLSRPTYFLANGTLYLQGLVLVAAVFGILAVSLDLVAGVVGLYSLGHAGLFAIGAYGTTILYNDHGWNLFLLLPASMLGVGSLGSCWEASRSGSAACTSRSRPSSSRSS